MIFDSYSRMLEVSELDSKTMGVVVTTMFPAVQAEENKITVTDEYIVLQRIQTSVLGLRKVNHRFDLEATKVGMLLTKPAPLPFAIENSPNPTVEPDGSYSYIPSVVGGVKDYEFTIIGDLTDGVEFNSQTGGLSRPPQ